MTLELSEKGHLIFPQSAPADKASGGYLWRLQLQLFEGAQRILGPSSTTLYQPIFKEGVPHIIVPSSTQGYAVLDEQAASSWVLTVYQMAHETIHLLNPVVGFTNYLEEGIAVGFSAATTERLTGARISPSLFKYQLADALVSQLMLHGPEKLRTLREQAGGLHRVTIADITKAFPEVDLDLATKLAETCIPRG